MVFFRFINISFVGVYFFCASVFAGISLDSTRLIFSNTDKGQTIGVTSSQQSTVPYLVKAQVLDDIKGNNTQTPFSVSPSLFRLEIGATNQLRIIKTGDQILPHDKESLFYLRVMALPARHPGNEPSQSDSQSAVVVSTGSIIKLFYRPKNFEISQQQAMSSLKFSRQGQSLTVSNPSPYFITLSSLHVGENNIHLSLEAQNTMIPPFGSVVYPNVNTANKITWQAINDHGGVEKFYASIQ
ncbi:MULTISPECIES: fimbrial biogenesis chaperone [unclassified Providencia]|uniref:fimbrial biogenesis chaperone n=1 Tax=unclassified Providencia TaxID=2633465 RepID=UPI00234BAE40|nr:MULTISPECIES: molecular chaperone [unclassified Providencia]